jgi:hypothetical protein
MLFGMLKHEAHLSGRQEMLEATAPSPLTPAPNSNPPYEIDAQGFRARELFCEQ